MTLEVLTLHQLVAKTGRSLQPTLPGELPVGQLVVERSGLLPLSKSRGEESEESSRERELSP